MERSEHALSWTIDRDGLIEPWLKLSRGDADRKATLTLLPDLIGRKCFWSCSCESKEENIGIRSLQFRPRDWGLPHDESKYREVSLENDEVYARFVVLHHVEDDPSKIRQVLAHPEFRDSVGHLPEGVSTVELWSWRWGGSGLKMWGGHFAPEGARVIQWLDHTRRLVVAVEEALFSQRPYR